MHKKERETNPNVQLIESAGEKPSRAMVAQHRGPILYFAIAGITGALVAMPLIVPGSSAVTDDSNPIGYLVIFFCFPVGGLVYRLRSRNWQIDQTVKQRQRAACLVTLLLPISVALLTGMQAQGFHMTILSGMVAAFLMAGILVSGRRRSRNPAQ